MRAKCFAIVGLVALAATVIGCGSGGNSDSDILELQATVLALSVERPVEVEKEPLPTYVPLPTLEPLPTYVPLPTLEPLPTYAPLPTLEPVILIVTPTVTSTPTPTPTPSGYSLVKSQSGVSELDNFGIQGVLSGNIATPSDLDKLQFNAFSGQTVTMTMSSTDFDAKLTLLDSEENLITRNDDSGGSTNSYITRLLTANGRYVIHLESATMGTGDFGDYTLNFYLTSVSN